MAVDPLYNTKADLLLKIRLSDVPSEQTNAVIDMVISQVRVGFFSKITKDRAIEIAAFTPSENPTTDNEILYSTASTAEGLWVTALLYDLLPTLFMESSNGAQQNWNDEPLSRDAKQLVKAKQALLSQVDKLLGVLEVPVNDDTGSVKVFSTGREKPFILQDNFIGRF